MSVRAMIYGMIGVIVVSAFILVALMRPEPKILQEPIVVATSTFVSNLGSVAKPIVNPNQKSDIMPNITINMEIMAWIYPGDPTCNAKSEYSDGRKIDALKPEYFSIGEGGTLLFLSESANGCNGYSLANIASLKKNSKEQYVTVSSSDATNMNSFLDQTLVDDKSLTTLVDFVVINNLTGVELDFEDFGGWSIQSYSNYKQFINKLGNILHQKNKKLLIDGPATSNQVEENWYVWRYADFKNLPVDKVVVMTYDYQFDQGVGEPVSPLVWLKAVIEWTLGRFPDKHRLSFGVPSYGYKGLVGSQKFSLLTYEQIKKEPGFESARRDPNSFEMTWQNINNVYFYQDALSMSKKLELIRNSGITSVSVWHLGGNLWFAK